MTRATVQSPVLISAGITAGVFLLLSTTLWYALGQPFTSNVIPTLGWYCALGLLNVFVFAFSWRLLYSQYRPLVPRLRLLSIFAIWILLIVAPQFNNEPSAIFYLRLLELPAFCLLGIALTYRVLHVFVPRRHHRWFTIAVSVLAAGLLFTASSPLNIQWQATTAAMGQLVTGPAHTAGVIATFVLFLASVLAIPLGRARYSARPSLDIGPHTFTNVQDGQDMNLTEVVSQLIHDIRRRALKRGQWVRYRNHTNADRGIVFTKPKSCINALTTLFEYALHKNQSKTINVELLRDSNQEYIHCSIDYVVNTHAKTEFKTYAEHFADLGGQLTVQRTERVTKLIVTFPHQW